MAADDLLYFKIPAEMRAWLEANHLDRGEFWLCYYKKATGLPSVTWSESVDEALCFGWIDGIRRRVDEQSYKIRFTPRRKGSHWSRVNVEKAEALIKEGRMRPEGLVEYRKRKASNTAQAAYEKKPVALSPAYERQLMADAEAWAFFEKLAPSYKRISIHWVMGAKREQTRLRRMGVLLQSCKEGKKIPSLRRKGG